MKPAGAISRNGPLFKQPFSIGSCQLNLCRMISQANRHPGYATCLSTRPVEAFRPPTVENIKLEYLNQKQDPIFERILPHLYTHQYYINYKHKSPE
jgi:hypothetical protein